MNASELRIGNYIKTITEGTHSQIVWQISLVGSELGVNSYHISKIKPVLITKKKLLNFGYSFENDFVFTLKNDFRYSIFIKNDKYYFNYQGACGEFLNKRVKYVHQIQNLYFSLTGHELTVA
ncbi:hypothetical protein AAIP58_000087 [Flavobacterium psychrophilum]|nr:hypothetical protein [Flavobacterium psychrophilum]